MKADLKKELLERFLKYVKIDTQANPNAKAWPSNKGQLVFGKMLASEMKKIGIKKISVDKNGYVMGELPANTKKKIPVIGLLAHLDTAVEESGKNVKPQIHKNYRGGNIIINKKKNIVLKSSDSVELKQCIGHDIITASGGTLLGGDNKAGISIILTALHWLIKNPQIKHGAIKVCFTPDEEIHRSDKRLDVKKLGVKYGYTFDGSGIGIIEGENFNASGFEIKITGKNYHPGYSKNVMISALRIVADIVNSWPSHFTPEHTENKEGFICFMECESKVDKAKLSGIIRDHDIKKLRYYEKLLKTIVEEKKVKNPNAEIKLNISDQYYNMKQIVDKHPKVTGHLEKAALKESIKPVYKAIRGGTDGAKLSFKGIPTPNFSMGGGNFHGQYEWISLEGMEMAAKVLIALAREWEQNP
jgi:tripeptide aminopeptidase